MVKRIQFNAHGGPEVLQWADFELADPAGDEMQVENRAIGINYIDTYLRSGLYPVADFSSGLGTEAAGVVTRVGYDVTLFKPGDRVVYCQAALGAYSEAHNVAKDRLMHLPNAINFEQGAASFLKGLTTQYLLRQTYKVKADETFLSLNAKNKKASCGKPFSFFIFCSRWCRDSGDKFMSSRWHIDLTTGILPENISKKYV